jgi:hypothetical protein
MRRAQRAQAKDTREVVVAYCHPDINVSQFTSTMIALTDYDAAHRKKILNHIAFQGGPRISEARNWLAGKVLDHAGVEWMWMIDADMAPQPDILYRMLDVCASDPKIRFLGALAFIGGRTWDLRPNIYTEPRPGHFELAHEYPEDALVKVAATGAACMLVHREVLEEIRKIHGDEPKTWFKEVERQGNDYGEDITFCQRVREVGYDVYVHTGIEIGHIKAMPLHSGLYKLLRQLNPYEQEQFAKSHNRAMGLPC